jgi:hypothetical protein
MDGKVETKFLQFVHAFLDQWIWLVLFLHGRVGCTLTMDPLGKASISIVAVRDQTILFTYRD